VSALADMPAVLTVEEAAAHLRIGRSAAYAAARSGDLPVIRIGRVLRVPRQRLAELLGETTPDALSPAGEPGSGGTSVETLGGKAGDAGAHPTG
jgi:excisionase family DNA binding protein